MLFEAHVACKYVARDTRASASEADAMSNARDSRVQPVQAVLHQHPLFKTVKLSDEDAALISVRSFGPDTTVVRAGSPQSAVLVLISGGLVLHARTLGTRRGYLAGLLEAPTLLGDLEMLSRAPWGYSILTNSSVTCVEIPNALFERLAKSDPTLAVELYRCSSIRGLRMRGTLERLLTEPLSRQLITLLWDVSQPGPEKLPVARLSQSKLARALGVDRKTIARNLARLAREGQVRVSGRDATLLRDRRATESQGGSAVRASGTWRIAEHRRRRGDGVGGPVPNAGG